MYRNSCSADIYEAEDHALIVSTPDFEFHAGNCEFKSQWNLNFFSPFIIFSCNTNNNNNVHLSCAHSHMIHINLNMLFCTHIDRAGTVSPKQPTQSTIRKDEQPPHKQKTTMTNIVKNM